MLIDDLVRYQVREVERVISDTLNFDPFAMGIFRLYQEKRSRMYGTMKTRKCWWEKKPKPTKPRGARDKTHLKNQLCNNFNAGYCKFKENCWRRHACSECGKDGHPVGSCPKKASSS